MNFKKYLNNLNGKLRKTNRQNKNKMKVLKYNLCNYLNKNYYIYINTNKCIE